jgi:hypothetical protein
LVSLFKLKLFKKVAKMVVFSPSQVYINGTKGLGLVLFLYEGWRISG